MLITIRYQYYGAGGDDYGYGVFVLILYSMVDYNKAIGQVAADIGDNGYRAGGCLLSQSNST